MERIFAHTQRTYWKWDVWVSWSWQEVTVAHSVTDAGIVMSWAPCEAENNGKEGENPCKSPLYLFTQ